MPRAYAGFRSCAENAGIVLSARFQPYTLPNSPSTCFYKFAIQTHNVAPRMAFLCSPLDIAASGRIPESRYFYP